MRNHEHVLVPFQPWALPDGPWLVFAPHADDETFGMGGTLYKAGEQGIETHVVVLTDGALGGEAPDLVEIRRAEAKRAVEILGVTSLQCWTEPDRGLSRTPELVARIADLIKQIQPLNVFFPGPLELHPDHRTTTLLVWDALCSLQDKDVAPQAIAYEIGVQNPINRLVDITAQKSVKEKAMAVYASQNAENDYPDLVLALDKARTYTLPPEVEYAEGFYVFSTDELKTPLQDVLRRIIDQYLE